MWRVIRGTIAGPFPTRLATRLAKRPGDRLCLHTALALLALFGETTMIVSKRFVHCSNVLVWLVSLGVGAFFPVTTALAAPRDNGYSLTLTESTSSMYYGDVGPMFQAVLTVPPGEPPMPAHGITVAIDGAYAYTGDVTGSAPNYTLTMPATSVWGLSQGCIPSKPGI